MNLSGDQDVRIDFTNNATTNSTKNQITGLDLNGNGAIANDGKENALTFAPTAGFDGDATGYKAVDAYTRLTNGVVNESNLANVFLGDIKYDGTGNAGDGTTTNGNVVLGGLGADTILGGIGNDFLAGGAVALSRVQAALAEWVAAGKPTSTFVAPVDTLSGGRNADFLFAELSLLTNTDGNQLFIDGGATADNTSAANGQSSQDSDWLLLQASDDDERIEVVLTEDPGTVGTTVAKDGTLVTRAGQYGTLKDIENLDASGNTYGFIKGLTAIGGAPVNANNNGIGSSGQLNVTGSIANNIIIGGYDNDAINGGAGNDTLMGGNLKSYATDGVTVAQQILDANLVGLTGNNDGRDELTGGAGADNILFEADGGIIEGGSTVDVNDDPAIDTLWLTQNSLGAKVTSTGVTPVDVSELAGDKTLRFDLGAGKFGGIDNYSGYGGAGDTDKPASNASKTTAGYTADQTNYTNEAVNRVQVQDMEDVIATGLGAIDYKAAGGNSATDVTFQNQQNFQAYNGNLDLRGTSVKEEFTHGNVTEPAQTGANTLYAAAGADTIEGRTGNDLLSGGDGVDNFIFNLGDITTTTISVNGNSVELAAADGGDGLDVIWRQLDTDQNNIWDVNALGKGDGAMARVGVANQAGLMGQDFGKGLDTVFGGNNLKLDFTASQIALPTNHLINLSVKIGATTFALTDAADLAELKDAHSVTAIATVLDRVFKALDPLVSVKADTATSVITVTDKGTATNPTGRTINLSDVKVTGTVDDLAKSFTNPSGLVTTDNAVDVPDRIVFAAYNNRADGELVDDSAEFGGDTLGTNNYAQDLVVGFGVDGSTILAERQSFRIDLKNTAVQDVVTVSVNGVQYSLTVGMRPDKTLIANETTEAFAERLSNYINSFLDNDTAAGKVDSAYGPADGEANDGFFTLTQQNYTDGEESVFMNVSVKATDNSSNGEGVAATVTNLSSTDITLYKFDGRDGKLNALDVIFVGDSGIGPDGTTYSANSRAVLATAKNVGGTLNGSDAIVIDVTADADIITSGGTGAIGGKAIAYSNDNMVAADLALGKNKLPTTGETGNYAIHGDDQLIGGNSTTVRDSINAGTGDDRVYGSLGKDQINGGKDLYWVDKAIQVLNTYEASVVRGNPATVDIHKLADTNNDGQLTAVDVTIGSNQPGQTSDFTDTLVYQQSDFGTVGATGAKFKIGLDLSTLQKTGGSGHVITNDAAANTSLFTNMERIRTVSGDGTWVGQGNDTIDLSQSFTITVPTADENTSDTLKDWTETAALNNVDTYYDLTKGVNAGQVWLNRVTSNVDYESYVTTVDGVEHVITGGGNDTLVIDQTESGKNNSFTAGLNGAISSTVATIGNDVIEYRNNSTALTKAELGTLTLTIGLGTAADNGVDTLMMTGGMMGTDKPTDTLTGVEVINTDVVARNSSEADVVNVSAMTSGAVVNFTDGTISNVSSLQATVVGLTQYEKVIGSVAADKVIVANNMTNAREDSGDQAPSQVAPVKILFDSYLNYDVVDDGLAGIAPTFDTLTVIDRLSVATLRSIASTNTLAAIPNVLNTSEYTFDLGASATGTKDRVDYAAETGSIAVVVKTGATSTNVLVSQLADEDNNNLTANTSLVGFSHAGDRIDVLTGVEEVVASNGVANGGASILDFTNFGQAVTVDYQYATPITTNLVAGQVVENSIRIGNANNDEITGITGFIERYTYNTTATAADATKTATWNRIEGSDFVEKVSFSGSENLTGQNGVDHRFSSDTLNLRGSVVVAADGTKTAAQNEVSYNKLETSVYATVTVKEWVGNEAIVDGTRGTIATNIQFLDGTGNALIGLGNDLLSTNQHNITSYTSDNAISAGNLKLEGTQDKEDTVLFSSTSDKVFVLGTSQGVLSVRIGGLNSMVMTGFEFLGDAGTNDVYQFDNMITGLFLTDNAADHDTIKVGDGAAANLYNGNAGTTVISLQALNANSATWLLTAPAAPVVDFDVLDLTKVTSPAVTTVFGATANIIVSEGVAAGVNAAVFGATDEVVFGKLLNMATVSDFESVVLTQDTIGENGTTYVLNANALGSSTITAGAKTITLNNDANTVSFGGTVLEQVGSTLRAATTLNATSGVTVTVNSGTGTEAFNITGGNGIDTITGGAGADTIRGNIGNDILDGGFKAAVAPIVSYDLNGAAAALGADGNKVAILGVTVEADSNASVVASATNIAVVVGADADAVGGTFAAVSLATWKAQLAADATFFAANGATVPLATAAAANLTSVTYDAVLNKLLFTFNNTAQTIDNTDFSIAVVTGGSITATLALAQAAAPRGESSDTYVFEATATLNGADTINNFNAGDLATDDLLNFTAFLGAAATSNVLTGLVNGGTGGGDMTLASGGVGVFFNVSGFNKDMINVATAANGELTLANNAKAVILTTADTTGAAGTVANDAYKVYYVEDTDATGAQNWVVSLVGTINSATELTAANLFANITADSFI